jgi:sodium transport system ATP-binding protein
MAVISAQSLTRTFGSVLAANAVTFHVDAGEVVGLLGPNGAGKTTTLRMIASLLQPTSGTAVVGGHDVRTAARSARASLGLVTASAALFPRLTPREFLRYIGALHGLRAAGLEARVDAALERFEIEPFEGLRCGALSTGQRQRVLLARASLHDPPALILDEPSAGLDVLGAQAVVNFVRESKSQGKAVLLSTHDMAEAEYLCDRIVIIAGGRVVATGTSEELRAASGKTKLAEVFLHYVLSAPSRKTREQEAVS